MRKDHSKLLDQVQARSQKDRYAQQHSEEDSESVLTQEELMRWWPFTRLAPHRFPKSVKATYPEATL